MGEPGREGGWTPPSTFDSFRIERPLGVGGMGHVYLGRDTMLDRRVALKFIASDTPSPEARERFLIEARAIAKLLHPNVVGVFRIGEVDGRPYIAYELVDGCSLDDTPRPISWGAALRIATLLVRGLEAAHRVGIVHRDIKPSNVMLSSSGEVKLLDFGIAKLDGDRPPRVTVVPRPPPWGRAGEGECSVGDAPFAKTEARGDESPSSLTRPGALIGTPGYLAPELWTGEGATPRSDVFAVGLVIYELLTGSLPFAPLSGAALAQAVTEQDIPSVRLKRPEVPQAFAAIIDRCLRRHPLGRYDSATALRADLEDVRSVYLARDELDDLGLDGEARLVADSFARLLPKTEELVTLVYKKLFTLDPSVRALFPEDMTAQRKKLAHALKLAIDGLHEPSRITPMLRELGRRHAAYGVTPAHFETLGQSLFASVRELDRPSWSDELGRAWRRAYAFLATAMRQGLAGAGTTAASQLALHPYAPMTPPARRTAQAPRTQYARNGETTLAYHVLGQGPDLLVMLGWVTHIEVAYGHPSLAGFLCRLARDHRVILFDKRGTGLSDRVLQTATFEERTDDIAAVMDAAGSQYATLFGTWDAGALAAYYAAVHPERVRGVAVWGSSARLLNAPTYDAGVDAADLDRICAAIMDHWGEPFFAELEAPSMKNDPAFVSWLGRYMRMSASPGNAAAILRANAQPDLRAVLPHVSTPMLVMHRTGDRVAPVRGGRAFAELVPHARFCELEGDDHTPFTGDVTKVHAALDAFLSDLPGEPREGAPLASLVAFGDAPSIGLLVQAAMRMRGRYVGDGVFAFDGLVRALSFALKAVAEHALRAGVHVGPCPVGTPASEIADARTAIAVASHTARGAVRATDRVRDLGVGLTFELRATGESIGPLAILEVC
jgi:eukaryotic-like serine/threonine-protein kinase